MRCAWAEQSDAERVYHDTEWGTPVHDDRLLFEGLALRGVQAGLAWRIVLTKRDAFRRAFHGFDIARVAAMSDAELAAVRADRAVIRNRLKLDAIRSNARVALRIAEDEGSFSAFLWSFVGGVPKVNFHREGDSIPVVDEASDRMSAALRKRGFRFAGSTICYAAMQSVGMVDDHVQACFRRC
ncbi:DNA-3-methyladenine glycosylase I [Luteibacter yeojuensis]|uniref:DNA-3-methyladenine glycosylase I n=1 Tax=Luteibacter yeojuensis TaxID=345309 RepID=A0A7X5QXS9_9GAMM|nr:DNA-3-methyladenine glycosylase I [Luteibacter yeojuensis]NID17310.1 DNA-3-methyladenine glycosylase I [Luteibacter yeojuensis]